MLAGHAQWLPIRGRALRSLDVRIQFLSLGREKFLLHLLRLANTRALAVCVIAVRLVCVSTHDIVVFAFMRPMEIRGQTAISEAQTTTRVNEKVVRLMERRVK